MLFPLETWILKKLTCRQPKEGSMLNKIGSQSRAYTAGESDYHYTDFVALYITLAMRIWKFHNQRIETSGNVTFFLYDIGCAWL